MIIVNSIKFNNKKHISFKKETYNNISNTSILALQAPDAKRQFAGNLYITQQADAVQNNPAKAFVYKIVKAYNMAVQSEQKTLAKPKQISFVG